MAATTKRTAKNAGNATKKGPDSGATQPAARKSPVRAAAKKTPGPVPGTPAARKSAAAQQKSAPDKQLALHAGEMRQKAVQGSIGTRDRRNQGKRDHR